MTPWTLKMLQDARDRGTTADAIVLNETLKRVGGYGRVNPDA